MKKTKLFLILCATALLCGCSKPAPEESYVPEDGIARLGSRITVEPFDQLTLLEVNDSLSKKGLYYATWKDGEASPYENRQGDTVDLYDAQLTFLASEAVDELEAKENYNFWISTAEENYDVYETETITCNEQEYCLCPITVTMKTLLIPTECLLSQSMARPEFVFSLPVLKITTKT